MKKIFVVLFLFFTCSLFAQEVQWNGSYDSVAVDSGSTVSDVVTTPTRGGLGMAPAGVAIESGIADSVYIEGSYDGSKFFVINYDGAVYYAVGDSTQNMGLSFKVGAMANVYSYYRFNLNTAVDSDTVLRFTWIKLF